MTTDEVTTILAVLAIFGATIGVGVVLALLVPSARDALLERVGSQGIGLAWLVAIVATLGSLYLSDVAHFTPCRLCWYQRIAMYPLVVVLGVGWFRRDVSARISGLILAGLGLAVNLWHLAVELRPTLEGAAAIRPTRARCGGSSSSTSGPSPAWPPSPSPSSSLASSSMPSPTAASAPPPPTWRSSSHEQPQAHEGPSRQPRRRRPQRGVPPLPWWRSRWSWWSWSASA